MCLSFLGVSDDEWALGAIILVGTVCSDDACARLLADSNIIYLLIGLLNGQLLSLLGQWSLLIL